MKNKIKIGNLFTITVKSDKDLKKLTKPEINEIIISIKIILKIYKGLAKVKEVEEIEKKLADYLDRLSDFESCAK